MVTLSAWVQSWIERRSIRLAPSTISGYNGSLRRYITPSPVGQLPLDEITDAELIILLSPIIKKGYMRQAQLVQILIGAALKDAVKRRMLLGNPMDLVDKIQHKSEFTPWLLPEESAKLLKTSRAAADPYYAAWLLGLCCGLRRGELLGLRWSDIDFRRKELHVRRQLVRVDGQVMITKPKTRCSERDIPLTEFLVDQLRFLRRGDQVVPGTFDQLKNALERALIRAELPRITLHGLRHSMAAVAATEGVPIKVLQEIMGHAQYSTTADVYAHVDRKAVHTAARQIATRLEIA